MVFSDLFFLFVFLPTFAICYLLGYAVDKWLTPVDAPIKHITGRNLMLVVFSLIFYLRSILFPSISRICPAVYIM